MFFRGKKGRLGAERLGRDFYFPCLSACFALCPLGFRALGCWYWELKVPVSGANNDKRRTPTRLFLGLSAPGAFATALAAECDCGRVWTQSAQHRTSGGCEVNGVGAMRAAGGGGGFKAPLDLDLNGHGLLGKRRRKWLVDPRLFGSLLRLVCLSTAGLFVRSFFLSVLGCGL